MILYPAIDMKDGQCVRLQQGRFDKVTVYEADPAKMARRWESLGASWVHVVDLDGALKGKGVNTEALRAAAQAVSIPVQTGGGIRCLDHIEEKLAAGVRRVIIGTAAVKDPAFLKAALGEYGPERIVVGIDAKDGMVALEGWEEVSGTTAADLGRAMKDLGVTTVVYTDISRDGMLCGPNVQATRALMRETGLTVIASGGVSSMDDLASLYEAGIPGVITGKALYEGRINLEKAILRFERTGGESA